METESPVKETTKLNIAMPANIRWSRYERNEDVKLENKFAPYPLTIPLLSDPHLALKEVSKKTSKLRSGFNKVYAAYMSGFLCGLLLPKFICKMIVNQGTIAPTVAFSNVPGPLHKLSYKGTVTKSSYCGFNCAGRCGLSVNILSYCEHVSFSIVSDTAVLKDPTRLKELMTDAINEYIELSKAETPGAKLKKND
jgi:hypothetical protein